MRWWLFVSVLSVCSGGCAQAVSDGPSNGGRTDTDGVDEDTGTADDTGGSDGSLAETSVGDTGGSATDTGGGATDTGTTVTDTGTTVTDTGTSSKDTGTGTTDTGTTVTDTGTTTGPIGGGPCASGGSGATAFRVRWAGSGSGSTAYPVYEVTGLPDKTGFKAGAYGYSIGYTPTFEDPFLGVGGLRLDSSAFVDIDFSTSGISSISRATLSIFGRSYNTTASGSYNWQTFDGTGSTPTGAVSNSAPYQWYGPLGYLGSGPIGDVLAVIKTGKTIKLRIKAGGPSGALIVNKIELCLEAT